MSLVKLLVLAKLLGLIFAGRQRCQAMHSVSEMVSDKSLFLAKWIFSLQRAFRNLEFAGTALFTIV